MMYGLCLCRIWLCSSGGLGALSEDRSNHRRAALSYPSSAEDLSPVYIYNKVGFLASLTVPNIASYSVHVQTLKEKSPYHTLIHNGIVTKTRSD